MAEKYTDGDDFVKGTENLSSPVRCRKCRQHLFKFDRLIVSHGSSLSPTETSPDDLFSASDSDNDSGSMASNISSESECDRTQWFLDVNNCPSWVMALLEQHAFTKGKLLCPKCAGRIGSFDFLTAVKCLCLEHILPPIRIAKNRVDLTTILDPSALVVGKGRQSKPTSSFHTLSTYTNDSVLNAVPEIDHSPGSTREFISQPDVALAEVEDPNRGAPSQVSTCTSEAAENPASVDVTERTDDAVNLPHVTHSHLEDSAEGVDFHSDPKIDALTCPVCLELFYLPHQCIPCKHIYCGPCLQRLAASSSHKTKCPLCREVIWKCLPDTDLDKAVREGYPSEHKTRHKTELKHKRKLPALPRYSNSPFRLLGNRRNRNVNMLTVLSGTCFVVLFMILGFTIFALTVGVFLWYLTEIAMDIFIDIFMEVHNFFDYIYQALVFFCIEGRIPQSLSTLLKDSARKMFTGLNRLKNNTELILHERDVYYKYGQVQMRRMSSDMMSATQRLLDKLAQSGIANYLILGVFISYLMYRLAKFRQNQLMQRAPAHG